MPLPVVALGTGSVDIGGTSVPIRSLSRDEVIRMAGMDAAEAETLILSAGTDSTEDEAIAWRKSVSAPVAEELLQAISILSGLRQADPKASPSKSSSDGL